MEEQASISFVVNMKGNRLDMSLNKDELVLTANVPCWAAIYAQLKDVFGELEDA